MQIINKNTYNIVQELIRLNILEEGKDAQPVFISVGLCFDLRSRQSSLFERI